MLALSTALPLSGLAGFAAAAALSDARTLRIPNFLSLCIFGLFGIYAAQMLTPQDAAVSVGLAAVTLVVGFVAYTRNLMGGGDAKLLAACMAWAGAAYALEFLIVTALAGGLLALALSSPLTARAAGLVRRDWPVAAGQRAMPYGVAIACGALVVAAELFTA